MVASLLALYRVLTEQISTAYDDVPDGRKTITVLYIMNIGSRGDIYKEG